MPGVIVCFLITTNEFNICFEANLIIGFFIFLSLSNMVIMGEEREREDYIEKSDLEKLEGCSRNTKIEIHHGRSKSQQEVSLPAW